MMRKDFPAVALLFAINKSRFARGSVSGQLNNRASLTEKHTSGIVWRVRIIAPPKAREFDEYDVRRFEVGQVYEVSARLATLLILGGYAEPAAGMVTTEAADWPSKPDKPE
jgi:hypothetical protein